MLFLMSKKSKSQLLYHRMSKESYTCPIFTLSVLRSSYPFYNVSFYIKWVTTSWTFSTKLTGDYSCSFCFFLCVNISSLNSSVSLCRIFFLSLSRSTFLSPKDYALQKETALLSFSFLSFYISLVLFCSVFLNL